MQARKDFGAPLPGAEDAGVPIPREDETDDAAAGGTHISAPALGRTPSPKRRLVLLVDAKGETPVVTGYRWEAA